MKTPKIIFEDDEILVLDKPAGLVVNRAETVKEGSLQDWLDSYLKLEALPGTVENKVLKQRSGLAHRLDKDTSGCLLIGKNPASLYHLLAQFKNRTVEKEYLALVHGRLEPGEGQIRLPIGRDTRTREKWRVHYSGREAQTGWKVEKYYKTAAEVLTLVRLFPKTGRTHQIRVHLGHLGHPLFSDGRYLGSKRFESDSKLLSRHFLHAAKISFEHPTTGQQVMVESELPSDLKAVIDQLDMPLI